MSAASECKYPDVQVELSGQDGNVFVIIGRVGRALKKAGIPREEIDEFYATVNKAKSYEEALNIVMATVDVS